MKKFIELFKAWRRGDTIEAEFALSLPMLLLIIGIIALLVWAVIRYTIS